MTNQEHNQRIYRIFKDRIDKGEWGWYNQISSFKCVNCGGYVTSRTYQFFNGDLSKLKCYKCQGIKK